MPELNQMAFKPATDSDADVSAANTQVQSKLPGKAGYCWVVDGYSVTTDGNVVAAVTSDITSGALVVDKFAAPSGAPINRHVDFAKGVLCPVGQDVTLTVPACGAGVKAVTTIRGHQVQI